MPNAVLATVVFLIGVRLIDYRGMASIYRLQAGRVRGALLTAGTVVVVGVEQGIVVAIALSAVVVMTHVYKPHDRVVTIATDGTRTLGPIDAPVQAAPGLVVYLFGAELFYANAARFSEEVTGIIESAIPPLRWLVLDAAAMGDLSYSGADTLRQVARELTGRDAALVLCNVDPAVRKLLEAYGLVDVIGEANIFSTVEDRLSRTAGLALGRREARTDRAHPE